LSRGGGKTIPLDDGFESRRMIADIVERVAQGEMDLRCILRRRPSSRHRHERDMLPDLLSHPTPDASIL